MMIQGHDYLDDDVEGYDVGENLWFDDFADEDHAFQAAALADEQKRNPRPTFEEFMMSHKTLQNVKPIFSK